MLGDASSSAASLKPYVFLGGSCDPTVWRREIALPKLDKYKIPYYNPQIDDWHPELIQLEAVAKEVRPEWRANGSSVNCVDSSLILISNGRNGAAVKINPSASS